MTAGTAARLDPFACPHCGYVADAASATDGTGAAPTTGSLSLCLACGELAIFEVSVGAVSLRPLTRVETHRATQDRAVRQARAAWRRARAQARSTGQRWPQGPGAPR